MITVYLGNISVGAHGVVFPGGDAVTIRVEGHSGRSPRGSDVVCAAVSALSQSCVIAISRVAAVRQDVVQQDGVLETRFILPSGDGQRELLKGIVGMLVVGLEEIGKAEGDALDIIYGEVDHGS